MSQQAVPLAERRRRLIMLAAEQRLMMAQQFEPCRRPLLVADHLLSIAAVLRRHPLWLLAGTLAFAIWPQTRLGGWLRRGWVIGRMSYLLLASRKDTRISPQA